MKKLVWGAGLALLMSGCAVVEMTPYKVTSFAEVPLTDKAKIKVVAPGGNDVAPVIKALKQGLAKKYEIVDEGADYWFILGGISAAQPTSVVRCSSVVEDANDAGGKQVIREFTKNASSAAKGVRVAVYKTAGLAPVHYFEIDEYDGDVKEGAVRDAASYSTEFTKYAVERIMDTFVTQEKTIDTPVTLKGDENLRKQLAVAGAADEKKIEGQYKAVVGAFAKKYADFMKAFKIDPAKVDLKKVIAAPETKDYKGPDLVDILSDYETCLLAEEFLATRHQDKDALACIRSQQLTLLENTDEKGLVEAVPVALARLEYKLSNLK